MRSFAGKTAVITGGGGGIGFALAGKCAEEGMNLVLADIDEAALKRAVGHFEERQQAVLGVAANTMIKESVGNLLAEARQRFGKVHLLFNNAGVVNGGPPKPIWEVPEVDWQWVLGVNLYGVLHGLQTFVPHMLEHGEESHIVNTASIAAFIPGNGPYGVSKYGVVTVSEALAQGLAAANANIGASVLCPGWVATQIGDAERNRPDALHNPDNPERKGLGIEELISGSKSPEELAGQVFAAIRDGRFYVLPHSGWDDMVRDHAAAIVAREGPYVFDMEAQIARGLRGEDV